MNKLVSRFLPICRDASFLRHGDFLENWNLIMIYFSALLIALTDIKSSAS